MARGTLFEYVVLYHPKQTKEQHERGEQPKSEVITPVTSVIALSDKEVGLVAARGIPESHSGKLEDIEIKIRPF